MSSQQQTMDLFDMDAAQAAGRDAMKAVANKADRQFSGWCELAVEKLRLWVREQSGTFTMEQARRHIGQHLPIPHDLRAWGNVTVLAKSRNIIVRAGSRPAASSHGSDKPTYRRGIGA